MPVGCDVGTAFLVSARQDANNQLKIKSIRDAFFEVDNDTAIKNMLQMSQVNYVESDDKLYIIGDNATVMANIFKREVRRPMAKGVLSPGELDAEKILLLLLENILGKALVKDEVCYYSVPAAPTDREIDIIYHQAMFSKLIGSLGYKPIAMNEAAAVVYSNGSKEQFSAIGISCGSGMINVCLMYKTMIGMSYSITNSGDWIDESAAKATGTTAARIQSIKEKGVDLMNPADGDPKTIREREAITIYYKSLALRILDSLKNEFMKKQSSIELSSSIPIIVSGGTAKAKNFLEFFKTAFETVKDKFPIPISDIRMATDPLNAVAQGLLIVALNQENK
jgi:actin-like ATPase involved in cell morphogenesis